MTTRPIGYPVGEITLATWFPKLDFLFEPGFTGASLLVGYSTESSTAVPAHIELYPAALNIYTAPTSEFEYATDGVLLGAATAGASTETEFSYTVLVADVKGLNYSLDIEYVSSFNLRLKDPTVVFSVGINNGEQKEIPRKEYKFSAARVMTYDIKSVTIDASFDKRLHIEYDTSG